MKPNETPEKRKKPIEEFPGAVPATDVPKTPEIPDPPVPNRAWTEMKLGLKEKIAVGKMLDFIKGTDVEKLLKEYGVI